MNAACDSDKEVFTATGTVRVSVVDRALVSQAEEPPGNQAAIWNLETVELEIGGLGVFDYNPNRPICVHRQSGFAFVAPVNCEVLGYAFEPDAPLDVTMRLRVSGMQVIRAFRPVRSIPPNVDYDNDGEANETDNCVLIPNPGQEDVNNDGFGDACSLPNAAGDPTIPDRDRDGVADGAPDNCLWIYNPGQGSGTVAGVGAACERVSPVTFSGSTSVDLTLVLPSPLIPVEGALITVSAIFNTPLEISSCYPPLSCSIDPDEIKLEVP